MTSQNRYLLGLIYVIAAAVAWSLSGLFTRSVVADTQSILFWRGLFGAAGLAVVVSLVPSTGGVASFRLIGKAGFMYAAITALSMVLFISALQTTSVAHVAIITAVVPFTAAYLGLILLRERPHGSAVIASAFALIGVMIMVVRGSDGKLFGDSLAILMAACMAGMILISRRFTSMPALQATCLASLLTALAVAPFAIFSAVSSQDLQILALFGMVNQVLGFGLFALGARHLPPMETALITALDAPLAPFWVWLFFAEIPGTATVIGGAVVFAAVVGHVVWVSRD